MTASATRSVAAGVPGRHNDLTDVGGIRVGHHQRRGRGWLTGTTVVLPPSGTVGGVDVRGGGPSTRETDALAPTTLVSTVDAVVFSGGSSYGLSSLSGVTDWLGERGVGFPVGPEPGEVVPIVAGACLFDLGVGGQFSCRPDASFGRAAADAASTRRFRQGTVGAGTGAHAGVLKGGVGSASVVLDGGVTVAALVALNSSGQVVNPATGALYGLGDLLVDEVPFLRRSGPVHARPERLPASPATARNTLLAVVATDATLEAHECARIASAGHDGMARAVRPVHTMTDGDAVFSLATGQVALSATPPRGLLQPASARPGQLSELMCAAADTVARAIVHAVVAARSAGGMLAYLDAYPTASC